MKKSTFTLPPDYEIPEVEDGETFEAVAEIRKDGEKYTLISLDGMEYNPPELEESDEPMARTIARSV